jgi:hypothetical protein
VSAALVGAAPWPYRRSPEWIAARLARVAGLYDAGKPAEGDIAARVLRRALGAEAESAIAAVRAMPVFAEQGALFGGDW